VVPKKVALNSLHSFCRRITAVIGLAFWFYLGFPVTGRCQTDSARVVTDTASPTQANPEDTSSVAAKLPSPRKALILSAVLPGAGQIYNKRYWKVPLIYIGAGILGYNIQNFYGDYVLWRDAFIAKQKYGEYILDPVEFPPGRFDDLEVMRRNREQRRRYFELNIILCAVLYALNVVDANVDAHLKGFQLGNDGLSLTPALPTQTPGAGLTLRLTLK